MFKAFHMLTAAAVTLAASLAAASAQAPAKPGPAAAKPLTTSSGVYTAAQAARGEQTYMNVCVSCHPPGTYKAAAFRAKWNLTLLSDLYGFVSNMMPKNEPGTLEDEEYAAVIAYILKINGAPPGKTALPADIKELRKIRILMPADTK
jgi:S-disulfanyl-L-cysteine oxidoreductase SoxD